MQVMMEQLRLVNEELQHKKLDAEKDRDFFKDQYSKASAHVSEVSRENNELLERAALAEGQIHNGLAMIKATYEERINRLEAEVLKWKGLCQVLTSRDSRVDDDVRRRAAVEPELREENARLREKLTKLSQDYHKMESVLEELAEQEREPGESPDVESPKTETTTVLTSTSMHFS